MRTEEILWHINFEKFGRLLLHELAEQSGVKWVVVEPLALSEDERTCGIKVRYPFNGVETAVRFESNRTQNLDNAASLARSIISNSIDDSIDAQGNLIQNA